MSKTISVELPITDDQQSRLQLLLQRRREVECDDGIRPFEDWTIKTLLGSLIKQANGCEHVINRYIQLEEYCQQFWKKETPAAGTARESCN